MPASGKLAFVTVGTTRFDALVNGVASVEALRILADQGYTCLRIQYGSGEPPLPVPSGAPPIRLESYRFKDTLAADMREASLLISHAGAGSIMEGLRVDAHLLVVANDALMDNHQQELARELDSRSHLVATTPAELLAALRAMPARASSLVPFAESDASVFPDFLAAQLGLG